MKQLVFHGKYMDVSENSGTPKSSILIGFSIIDHPFWGTPIFGNTHISEVFLLWLILAFSIPICQFAVDWGPWCFEPCFTNSMTSKAVG